MELRYATTDDAAIISSFAAKAFYDSYAWYNTEEDITAYINQSFNLLQIAGEIADPQSVFLLVIDTTGLCGYAKLVWRGRPDTLPAGGTALEIARLYAKKEFIGKGVGKMLMEACITCALNGSAASIWLDVWKENKKAIQFYKKWGFEIVSDWHFLLGKDLQQDLIMQKDL